MTSHPGGPRPDRRPRHSAAVVHRRRQSVAAASVVLLLVLVVALVNGLGGGADGAGGNGTTKATPTATTPAAPTTRTTTTTTTTTTTSPVRGASAATTKAAAPSKVAERGTGELVTVPGSVAAPGGGKVSKVRVEVEGGVDVDPARFASEVLKTLNDSRSWGHGGVRTFARTAGDADVVVILASPVTSARLCRPLVTRRRLSCSISERAILTSYRWAEGTPEFDSLAQYRDYVVNHEVGHVLGHGHEQCGGPGRRAPVMQQQTKQVAPCRPNAWPHP